MNTEELIQVNNNIAKNSKRLEAFRNVFEKSDRILANEDVRVVILQEAPYGMAQFPAWTDGQTVWINGGLLGQSLADKDLKHWVRHAKSLNLHELCHVLFTPRKGAEIVRWVLESMNGWVAHERYIKQAWNILEDQRIEMMFVAKYRPAGAYFESMILHWFFQTPEASDTAFMLIHGRKYLPLHIREPLEARFVGKWGVTKTKEAKEIIDAYNRITFPTGSAKAKVLVTRFAKLIASMQSQDNRQDIKAMFDDNNPEEGANNQIKEGGQPDKKRQQEAQDMLDDVQPREPAFADDDEDDTEDDDNANGANQPGGDDDEGAEEEAGDAAGGEAAGDTGDAPGDAGDDGGGEEAGAAEALDGQAPEQRGEDGADDLNGEDGGGAGGGRKVPTLGELKDIMQDAMDDLMADDGFRADVDRVAKVIQEVIEDAEMVAEGDEMAIEHRPVPDALKRAATGMETELRQMRVSLEEQHLPRQQHGQIDAKRFLARQPWEIDFFRSYDPGALEETDVEAVILVDQSISMERRMEDVSAALWATKKALEEIDARVTVIGFADRHYVLYQPAEKVRVKELRRFPTKGGTVPLGALSMAYRMLHDSKRTIKIMITLTDGEWFGDKDKQDRMVSAINGMDVITSLMFIGGYGGGKVDEKHRHNHQIATRITDPSDLAKNAIEMVETAMGRMVYGEE